MLDAAIRIARAEEAVLVPAYLLLLPLELGPESAATGEVGVAMPLLEAVEQAALRKGVPVDARIERGRTPTHALTRLWEIEHFDRIVVPAGRGSGFSETGSRLDPHPRAERDHDLEAGARLSSADVCHHARMRRQLSWLIAVPITVIGTFAGHSVGYWAAVPDAHERAHLLASSGHGYLDYAPLLLSICVALVALGFVASLLSAFGEHEATPRNGRVALVAALAPAAFVLQELLERYLHDGHVHWGLFASAPFLFGLATQVPFALLAAAIAFALASAAQRVAQVLKRVLGRRPRPIAAHVPLLALDRSAGRACPRSRLRGSRPSAARLAEQERPIRPLTMSEERCTNTQARVRAGRCSSRSPPFWRRSCWCRWPVRTRG